MRSYRVYLALFIVAAAIVSALLHPLALLMAAAPFDTRGLIRFLEEVRSVIADFLGWGVLGLLAVMALYGLGGRLVRRLVPQETSARKALPSQPKVVVAITAYNDAEATAQAVMDFRRLPGVVGVLVIDNNSADQTVALAQTAGATVVRESRQGYGYACIRGLTEGLKNRDAEVIVLTEGDGTFFADDLPKLLAYIGDAALVVGNRVVRGLVDKDSQMDPFFTWGNMAVAFLLRLRFWDGLHLGPAGLMDVGCTYRAIRRDELERILPDLSVGGNHFSPHMLLVAMAHNLSVVEIPIRFRRRVGQSKGASQSLGKGLLVGLTMIWHILTFDLHPTPRIDSPKSESASPVSSAAVDEPETSGVAR